MPEDAITTKKEPTVPKAEPGVLIGVEVSDKPLIEFEDDEKSELKELCRKLGQRDSAARREQVVRIWRKHLYDRGLQHLLLLDGGGWQVPWIGSGYGPGEAESRSKFETNIYNPNSQIIISALTRIIPPTKFEPQDPDDDADITAAHNATRIIDQIHRGMNMRSIQQEAARYLWLDGEYILCTKYVVDAQRFGYEKEPEQSEEGETVPETEEKISEAEDQSATSPENSPEETQTGTQADTQSGSGDETEPQAEPKGTPRGRQVTTVGGALEWKLPMKANCMAEWTYCQHNIEVDTYAAKTEFPDVADDIKPGGLSVGGDDIDRLARINIRLGVLENWATTDSNVYDTTRCTTWLRPSALLECSDKVRDRIISKAGTDGLRLIFCGDTFCEARGISMDDQITWCPALPGDGSARPGFGDWIVPIQDRVNDWSELADDYFIRGVPNKWMDNEMFNVPALRKQTNIPGAVHPFAREQGVTMEQVIWTEEPLPFPEQLTMFIQRFTEEVPELLCGAVKALSGGGDNSATDTLGGMLVQREQALGRIGIPWGFMKEATAQHDRQAVISFARNNKSAVKITGSESVTIQMQDLKGNILAFPEVDEAFPESATQKANRIANLLTAAETNPILGQFLDNPDNIEVIVNASGLSELTSPVIEARDKQLGELVELLKTGPAPNPKLQQAQEELEQLQAAGQQATLMGAIPNPQDAQQIAQLQQQIQTMPPEISTVEVDPQMDDNVTEAYVCRKVINSPRGREMKDGTPQEQAAFKNLRLHCIEHDQAAAAKQGPPVGKPPSLSINAKDLPPKEAVQAMQKAGIQANAQDFVQQDAAEAAEKHPGQVTVQ